MQNFNSAGLPPGTSTSVLILASGRQPGVLNPGERIRLPVYFLGLLEPWTTSDAQVELEIRFWTVDDATAINWSSQEEALRPPLLTAEQWSPIYGNLTSGLGTTGDYVRMLNQNAQYLGQLGERIAAVDDLWNFEVQQAFGYTAVPTLDSAVDASMPTPGVTLDFARRYGNSIQSRYAVGPLGRGWFTPWQTRLVSQDNANLVQIVGEAGSASTFQKDQRNGAYFSGVGDSSTLVSMGAGVYELRAVSGIVTRFRADGKLDYVRDPNGNKVTVGYDGQGRLTSLTHTSGKSITIAYNGAGLIGSATDSAGRATTYGYDVTNNYLTTVTTADAKITRYTYQTGGAAPARHAILSIERGGTTQFFTYDTRGRLDTSYLTGNEQFVDFGYSDTGLVTIADAAGTTSLYFNENGLLAKTSDPLGRITTNEFNDDLRLKKTISPTGESQSFTWCSCGSMTSVTNELGQTTNFAYDFISGSFFKRMTSFTDAKDNKTSYGYDAAGNLLTTTYANGSVESLSAYTAAGLPGTSTNRRGQPLSYQYNTAGQVTRQTFADTTFITFAYDPRGNLTTITDGAEITTYTYAFATDGDRLKRVTYPNGRYLDYLYDSFGRRWRMTDQDGYATKYEYDPAGRLYRLRDSADTILVTYLYDPSGRLHRVDKGNGTFTTYDYDPAGQLLSLKNWRDASTLNSKFDYTYDARGRRVTMSTLDGDWAYTYDGAGQLTHATFNSFNTAVIPHQELQYVYDAVGNRTMTVVNGVSTVYVANNLNQYSSVGEAPQSYDLDGNLSFDGANTYFHDQQNRLMRVTGPHGVTEYENDAFGNRVAKVENGSRTDYLNDPSGLTNVTAEFENGVTRTTTYAHGLGLVGQLSAGAWNHFDFDALGSSVALTGQSGYEFGQATYDPFGKVLLSSGSINNQSFKYLGQFGLFTDTAGRIAARARHIDVSNGRFLSLDPTGLAGGDSNLYRLSGNNPISYIDPTGERSLYGALDKLWDYFERMRKANSVVGKGDKGLGIAVNPCVGLLEASFAAKGAVLGRQFGIVIGGTVGFFFGGLVGGRIGIAVGNFGGAIVGGAIGGWYGNGLGKEICPDLPPITEVFDPDGGVFGGEVRSDIINAFDPNEKSAGVGFGSQAFVAASSTVPYRIDFENDSTATAPAQVVTIADQLSADLDWSTFALTEIAWGDVVLSVPAGLQHYQTTQSMTYNGRTFSVLVEVGLRSGTGQVIAIFQSIDPNSKLPPNVLTGFLPPEDGTGRGMGHVSYVIQPKAGLATGTEIRNIALISFDGQLSISTDQVDPHDPSLGIDPNRQARITIDAGAPSSSVGALGAQSPTSFTVNWSGVDDVGGSGVATYDVFVADDGGAFVSFVTGTASTSATFNGQMGHSYAFYSVATDNVGNRQATPIGGQASTTVTSSVTPPTVVGVAPFVGPTSGGNVVVITGTGFDSIEPTHAAHAVTFGGTNATSYVVNSSTQITATVPAGSPATVNVTVTNAGGTSDTTTAADDYTYALPTVTSIVVGGAASFTMSGATWTNGNALVTVASTAGLVSGAQVSSFGAGFPARATVLSVDSGTTFTLSSAPTGTQSTATTIRAAIAPKKSGTVSQLTGATWTAGSASVTVASTAGLIAGQYVGSAAAGLPTDVVVASVTNGTTFTISSPATANATAATINVADAAIARDQFGGLVDLSGPNSGSVVQHLLVTFNQKVTLDANAFTITNLGASVTTNSVVPTVGDVAVAAAGIPGTGDDATGYTQYVLNFVAGTATNSFSNSSTLGNAFTTLKNSLFRLNTVGSKVHAQGDTGTNSSQSFWSLYGVVNAGDVFITGTPGGGNDQLKVDGLALNDMYSTFGSFANATTPPYVRSFDRDLDGDVDGVDLNQLYVNFGTIWNF